MVRNGTHKLVYRPAGVCELYDLVLDEHELNNVYDDSKYLHYRIELEKHMMEWLIRTGDVPPLRNDPRKPPNNPNPINQETCETLLQPDPSKDPEELFDVEPNDLMGINGIPHFST